ncbi:ABC transporter permease [Streptomyces sp. A1-5]|uniref:ABC transporter permease n=1 Tax=Streptomyces sp. A1-5 TaxID=2738410 RepID=UPI001F2D6E76|nr:ABC transporter permease [Streptomyces sp. A1-5]UJB42058.1 ABC transporter permease [Streptomyces sp. A1-5]
MSGFIVLRVRAHRALLAAALLSVLLTATVLATLSAFSDAVGDAGLRQALRGVPQALDSGRAGETSIAPATALQVKAQLPASGRQSADRAVERGARRAFAGLPFTVRTLTRSGPYALPRTHRPTGAAERTADATGGDEPDLTHLALLDRDRIELTAGRWPGAAVHGRVPVALPEAAATGLGLRPGRRLTLDNRLSGPAHLTIEVTGVYRPKDRTDPYWKLDELGGRGVRTLGFTTYGPLLTGPGAFGAGGPLTQDSVAWLATADFRTLTADRLPALAAAARPATRALTADPAFHGRATAGTELPDTLGKLRRSLLVNRSTVLIVALQLLLLAGYALLLVGQLLSTERTDERIVLRARGASRRRLAGLALAEALLLALPAAVAAPLLAGPLLRLLADGGWGLCHHGLGSLGTVRCELPLEAARTGATWLTGALVAWGCAVAVAAPAVLRSGADDPAVQGRTRPRALRAGADLGLLVVAGVAYWQLWRRTGDGGGVLTEDGDGTLGIDPVLVAAPALALLAGTVLTLRLLPPAAGLAERAAARGRGLAAALAGWQISRRQLRGTGPVLLLVLATALGMLAIGQRASWDRSQDDQADFRAAGPVRVLDGRTPQSGQGDGYAAVPGVAAALPVGYSTLDLPDGHAGSLLALDTRRAVGALRLRGDLLGGPADGPAARRATADLLRAAAPPAGIPPGIEIPADTAQLHLTLTLTSLRTLPAARHLPSDGSGPRPAPPDTGPVPATVSVLVTDAHGSPHALPLGAVPADGHPHTGTAHLAAAGGAPPGRPTGPLRLTGLLLVVDQPPVPHRQQLTVDAARAVTADGAAHRLTAPRGLAWTGRITDRSASAGTPGGPRAGRAEVPDGGLLAQTYDSGARQDEWSAAVTTVRITAAHPARPPLAAVATDAFLRASGSRVGAVVDITVNGQALKARIVRAVRALPGPADEPVGSGGLLVDFGAVNEALSDLGAGPLDAAEWWLRPRPGATATVVAALRARPDLEPGQVLVRDEIARELHDDPLGRGPQTALAAAAAVAVALAATGFAVGAAGSVRERAREFAVLRALGAPRPQLARMIAAEQGVLIVLALAVGTALGAVLTRAVVPLVVLTQQAGRPVPPVLVELPAGQVVGLLAAVAAVPLLVVAAVGLRRGDPVRALRGQGER